MIDVKNILQEDDDLNEDQLMQYLKGDLDKIEMHEIEKQMADSEFVNDAVEGLQSFRKTQYIEQYVNQLNHQLQKQTALKVKRKQKRQLKKNEWITLAVIIILLLSLLSYAVITKVRQQYNSQPTTK